MQAAVRRLTHPRSAVTASALGDVERRGRTEADHILSDLLRLAHTAVKAAGARAARETPGAA
jgi:2-dehydropantoate 2-reductase